jgi:hypothetical protein
MTRYFLGAFRYHVMHRGDDGLDMHDHPWWFVTFPLRSYVEETLTFKDGRWRKSLNVVKAFRFHFRRSRYAHRILGPLFKGFTVSDFYRVGSNDHYEVMDDMRIPKKKRRIRTLVIRGRVKEKWGFYQIIEGSGVGDWVPAGEYIDLKRGTGYAEGRTRGMPENRTRKP